MKKILYFLSHRLVVVGVALLMQLAVFVVMIGIFSESFTEFYWICILLSFLATLGIISSHSDPDYKIIWLVLILPFPVFGGMLYLVFGGSSHPGWLRRAMDQANEQMQLVLKDDFCSPTLQAEDDSLLGQVRYLEERAFCPAYRNSRAQYLPAGEVYFERLLEQLKQAERYIFLEYFIIQPGAMWDSILQVLTEKAAQGIDVRVMYDDMGCMFTLSPKVQRQLRDRGIRCIAFNRFVPVASLRMNNRDHRKLCVVDGTVAFTGGVNLADEYINAKQRFGHWKDCGIMVTGGAAWSMTVMFLTLWDHAAGEKSDFESLRPAPTGDLPGQGVIQPYTDSPLDVEPVGHTVYLNLINRARRYIYITTPYLILDTAIKTALCNAAKSGVDVRVITPHIPDKKMVFHMTRAFYEPLLNAGVTIYEYTPGFIHAKTFVADDIFATVGTVNLDYRSLFLHFENGVFMYRTACIEAIKEDFLTTQGKSDPVPRNPGRLNLFVRIYRSILRLFAPLM